MVFSTKVFLTIYLKNQQTDVHPTRVLFGTAYFSITCITLYLGPMKSLWAYIERMVGLSLS